MKPRRDPVMLSRRRWLTAQAIIAGADVFTAMEVVSSVAIEHPEWDMDEQRSWDEWMRE